MRVMGFNATTPRTDARQRECNGPCAWDLGAKVVLHRSQIRALVCGIVAAMCGHTHPSFDFSPALRIAESTETS